VVAEGNHGLTAFGDWISLAYPCKLSRRAPFFRLVGGRKDYGLFIVWKIEAKRSGTKAETYCIKNWRSKKALRKLLSAVQLVRQ
jgi:hypothetical protein